jgi:hypothetical protein
MIKAFAALAAAAALLAPAARAEEHLLAPEAARERLREAERTRQDDLTALTALIASDEGAAVLAAAGLDAARVNASLQALDDAELRELAARTSALRTDPVAGAAFTGKQVGIGAAIVLIVVFIIILA